MKTLLDDTYVHVQTGTLLHGPNELQDIYKHLFMNVLKYYCVHKKSDNQTLKQLIEKCKNYDELKQNIQGCISDECLSCNAMICFHTKPRTLLLTSVATLNRIKELDDKDEWFSNFALNNYLFSLCMITYDLFDDNRDGIFSVPNPIGEPIKIKAFVNTTNDSVRYIQNYREKIRDTIGTLSQNYKSKMINKSHHLKNPRRLLYFFGNTFRNFILSNSPLRSKDPEKALDAMVLIYPYFTGLTHGCDVFWINDKSPLLDDINDFNLRYPYSTVGYILNTNAYSDGKGQHWVCVIFKNREANLICSQASNWNIFSWSSKINSELDRLGYTRYYSSKTIQYDSSSCGLYSSLFSLVYILNSYCEKYNGPQLIKSNEDNNNTGYRSGFLESISNRIGTNAENIKNIYNIKKYLAGWKN